MAYINPSFAYSGYSGFSGLGLSGYSGFSGANGTNGTNGSAGTSGYSGFSGIKGSTGAQGAQGAQGFSGYSGYSGISGYSGFSGISGYSGFTGTSGYQGATGAQGAQGFQGNQGSSGYSGFSGAFAGTGSSGYGALFTGANSLSTNSFYFTNGNVGVGTTAPNNLLTVAGIVSATGTVYTNAVNATNGLYSISNFGGTFTDGILLDYTNGSGNGAGRISVGSYDSLSFYNGGAGSSVLTTLVSSGALSSTSYHYAPAFLVGSISQQPGATAILSPTVGYSTLSAGANTLVVFGGTGGATSTNAVVTFYQGGSTALTLAYLTSAGEFDAQSFNSISTRATKTNIQPFGATYNALQIVSQLNGVTYDSADVATTTGQVGVVAEDVLPYFPPVVRTNSDGSARSVDYSRLSVLLLEAVKSLQTQVAALSAKLGS